MKKRPPFEVLRLAHEASRPVRQAREWGAYAYRVGVPLTWCPHYWDSAEARAWKVGWFAEKEKRT